MRNQVVSADTLPFDVVRMVTYAEAVELLKVTKRTLRRRVAAGRYLTYGEGAGRRLLFSSIVADIRRQSGGGL